MTATKDPIISQDDLEELARIKYTDGELACMESFLSDFCKTARLYLTRIFVRGKISGKTFSEILDVCSTLNETVWKNGTEERIGDPDDVAPPNVGMNNTAAFYKAYEMLGLRSPKFLF